jgi:predicted dehydrogenase
MWRHHPQTVLAQHLIADGAIGDVAFIRAALTVDVPPGDIRRTGRLGGGAVLDLGCYCISAIRLFGGQPVSVSAARVVDTAPGADGADLRLAATLTLPGDVLAQFDVALDHPAATNWRSSAPAGRSPSGTRGCAVTGTWNWNAAAPPSGYRSTRPDSTGWVTPPTRITTTPTASNSKPRRASSPPAPHRCTAAPTPSTRPPRSRRSGGPPPPAPPSPCPHRSTTSWSPSHVRIRGLFGLSPTGA